MELRILYIAGPLIKVSITDGRRLILHYIGILSFVHGGHLETIQYGGWDPIYRVVTILNHSKRALRGVHGDPSGPMD